MKCIYPVEKTRVSKGTRILYSHRCGQCMPCRVTRKQEWTLRIMLEAKLHENNSFLTLTYDDDNRPSNYSLSKEHLQKFHKRLRKNSRIKYRHYSVGASA